MNNWVEKFDSLVNVGDRIEVRKDYTSSLSFSLMQNAIKGSLRHYKKTRGKPYFNITMQKAGNVMVIKRIK